MMMTILFAVFIGAVALGLFVLVRAGLVIPAGIVAFLAFLALLFLFDMQSPRHEIESLRSEISALRSEIRNMNNPAVLAGVCLAGASVLVGLVFFGVYGLMIIQAKIRRADRQERTERGGRYLPRRAQAVHQIPECERPESAKALEYRHDEDRYAVMPYQY